MKKAKAIVLIASIFLGVNSVNTTFAYWNSVGSTTSGAQGNINIGSFPSNDDNIAEGQHSFKRGDRFTFNNVQYCVLKDIESIYINESVLNSGYNYINLADADNYSKVNYYDEWSKPIYYGDKTDKAQPIVSYSTGNSPDSPDSKTKFMYNVLSQNMTFVSGFPYNAIGMVVRDPLDGAFYYNASNYVGSSTPSQTQNWGSGAPWKKIAAYDKSLKYSVGDYVYSIETDSVFVVTVKQKKEPHHDGPAHTPREFRPYNIATYITVGGQKKAVTNFIDGYTYFNGEYVLAGYDNANRALIYSVNAKETTSSPTENASKYIEILDPLLPGSTASFN